MAVGAADLGEHAQAVDLFVAERFLVALEVVVPAARSHEAALECADGDADVGELERLLLAGEGALERLALML